MRTAPGSLTRAGKGDVIVMIRVFFYCGVAVLAGELLLLAFNLRRVFAGGVGTGLKRNAAWALGAGVVCAAASLFVYYPYADGIRIYGFPFAAAALRYENGGWADYVGPMTDLYSFLNATVFFLLPQAVLFGVFRYKGREKGVKSTVDF